jgi:hypothetical protein
VELLGNLRYDIVDDEWKAARKKHPRT